MRGHRQSVRMRAPVLLVLAALLAAGCTGALRGEGAVEGDCGPASGDGAARSVGRPVHFYALHDDGARDVVFCVQVDDGPVHRQEMPGATMVPNVKRFATTDRAEDAMKVTAWLAGDDLQMTAFFPVTDENHVVLRLAPDGLRLEKHDEPPRFA